MYTRYGPPARGERTGDLGGLRGTLAALEVPAHIVHHHNEHKHGEKRQQEDQDD